MAWKARKTLGLAVQDGTILAAEVRSTGGRPAVSCAAAFTLPAHADRSDTAAIGAALGEFLRAHRFSAKHAVIGLPLTWVITKEQTVPPAQEAALTNMLRIQAERAFSHDGKDLTIDFLASPGEETPRSVLLFAAVKEKVEEARTVAQAAGLTVDRITPSATTLSLASAAGPGAQADFMLHVLPGSAELAISDDRRLRAVRHLTVAIPTPTPDAPLLWTDTLMRELRRVIATETDGATSYDTGRLVLWDGVGLPREAIDRLQEQLSLTIRENRDLSPLADVNGALPAMVDMDSASETGRFAAAVALARAAAEPELVAVDFLHSRLAPPRTSWFDKRLRLVAAASLAVAVAIGALAVEWHSASQAVSTLTEQLKEETPIVETAQTLIDKVTMADKWYEARPSPLECMLHVSRAFPDGGSIWATQLSVSDDTSGILSGKATDDRVILDVFKRLQESPAFAEVKLHGGIRYPKRTDRDNYLSFSISFRFREER